MPTLAEATRIFARIGIYSFGGPAAQIALMHRELVEQRCWLTEDQFLRALSFCMLLPGPEAMQLATYTGWRLHGTRGGLIAGLLFVLPGAAVVLALSALYAAFGRLPAIEAVFLGVKAAVVAIVVAALLKVAKKALLSRFHWVLAGASFVAIYALGLPFPLIVLTAGLLGALSRRGATMPAAGAAVPIGATIRTVAIWGAVWAAPVALVAIMGHELLLQVALFFSKLAVVTFGGAYAVLAYMAQTVVADYGWLTAAGMIDGLGLAETTPGPLILVTEFVGFQAGYGAGGWGLAALAALLTLHVTFAPCFLWIFAGAPYLDWLSARPRLTQALRAITAAVVGVILNLSLWFALHVLFARLTTWEAGPFRLLLPDPASLDPAAATLTLGAAFLLLRLDWPLGRLLAAAAVAGLAMGALGLA